MFSHSARPRASTGGGRLATDPVSVDAYRKNMPADQVVIFERSGDFPHLDEPARYADLIRAFVNQHAGSKSSFQQQHRRALGPVCRAVRREPPRIGGSAKATSAPRGSGQVQYGVRDIP